MRINITKNIKRAFDLVFATGVSVFALPITAASILVVKVKSPEDSALFKQKRIGAGNKEFVIYKLRTMTNERDENGELLPDEQRTKTWGKVIRKLSIDELPQILNILKGQMSWIGPRPLLPHEMEVLTRAEQEERQSMLPGITGLEAIHEDESDNRREMVEFDLNYVRKWSLKMDAKIFFETIKILLTAGRAEEELRAPKMEQLK